MLDVPSSAPIIGAFSRAEFFDKYIGWDSLHTSQAPQVNLIRAKGIKHLLMSCPWGLCRPSWVGGAGVSPAPLRVAKTLSILNRLGIFLNKHKRIGNTSSCKYY